MVKLHKNFPVLFKMKMCHLLDPLSSPCSGPELTLKIHCRFTAGKDFCPGLLNGNLQRDKRNWLCGHFCFLVRHTESLIVLPLLYIIPPLTFHLQLVILPGISSLPYGFVLQCFSFVWTWASCIPLTMRVQLYQHSYIVSQVFCDYRSRKRNISFLFHITCCQYNLFFSPYRNMLWKWVHCTNTATSTEEGCAVNYNGKDRQHSLTVTPIRKNIYKTSLQDPF